MPNPNISSQQPNEILSTREADSSALPATVAPAPMRVPLAALLSGRRWRMTARWVGLAIFVVGAGLLAWIFREALNGYQRFSNPGYFSLQFNLVAGDDWVSQLQAVIKVFGSELLRVIYLLLLGFLASAIASKGVQFFAASEAVIDEAVAAGTDS